MASGHSRRGRRGSPGSRGVPPILRDICKSVDLVIKPAESGAREVSGELGGEGRTVVDGNKPPTVGQQSLALAGMSVVDAAGGLIHAEPRHRPRRRVLRGHGTLGRPRADPADLHRRTRLPIPGRTQPPRHWAATLDQAETAHTTDRV